MTDSVSDGALGGGIRRRFNHDLEGITLQDAELIPQLQEGHKHTTVHEAIMLLEGEIDACHWDEDERIETVRLSKRGDLAVFPPECSHTLYVKKDSRIIVVRFSSAGVKGDAGERIPAPLPGKLEGLREDSMKPAGLTDELREEIEQELAINGRS